MKPLIIALDVETDKEALSLLKATRAYCDVYKIGPGLILRYGPQIIRKIRAKGKKVFLDLKFHDIPSTMARSVKEAAKAGAYSATVHTSAGETALKEVSRVRGRPQVWGVTVLTSLDASDLLEQGVTATSPADLVMHRAKLAKAAGFDGVIASGQEAASVRAAVGAGFLIVTPGIRLSEGPDRDQARVMTPAKAIAAGATHLVVGRPITEAADPAAVIRRINADISKLVT